MVNSNNNNDNKKGKKATHKKKVMHNTAAHHPLTDARSLFLSPDQSLLPDNFSSFCAGHDILWYGILFKSPAPAMLPLSFGH